MNPTHIDKKLIRQRFARHLASYHRYAVIQQEICERLAGLIETYTDRGISSALEIGAGTGFLTARLLAAFPKTRWVVNDLVRETEPFITLSASKTVFPIEYRWGDAETLDFSKTFDLIASASTLQWFENPRRFFSNLHQKSGGILAVSSFGTDNFKEIRTAAGTGLEYPSFETLVSLITHAGYDILFRETSHKPLYFEHPHDVLRHIRQTGVNGISSVGWTRKSLEKFCEAYTRHFGLPSGQMPLTYNPVIIVARKR